MVSTPAPMTGDTSELIKPDQKFIGEVMKRGGQSVKKCFQCGTCSVRCLQSCAREGASFPRRQILLTQWGQKDKVLSDPAIWQCYQCNDCSANCPRGAKPGDVLAAVRSIAIERFSFPSFLPRLFEDPRFLPFVFAIPAAILLALVAGLQGLSYPSGKIEYDRFITDTAIEIAAAVVVAFAVVVAGVSTLRFWRALRDGCQTSSSLAPAYAVAPPAEPSEGPGAMAAAPQPGAGLGKSLALTASDIVTHQGFRQCDADKTRFWGHLAVFYGAPFLMLAAGLAAIYGFIGAEVQRPASDPVKIFGNLGAVLVFAGVGVFVYNRLRTRKGAWGRAVYSDWLLLGMLTLLVVTGAFMEVARYSGAGDVAYSLYLVHLVIVFAAFVYAPYGKFAHTFYRTAALAFARLGTSGGTLAGPRTKAAVQAVVLVVLTGALAWHTISWHMTGEHGVLFHNIGESWQGTTKGVSYYIGLMAASGGLLGLLMERVTDLFGYSVQKIKHFEDEEAPASGVEETGAGERVA